MVDFSASPLVPAIVQDARTGRVLMLAHMNEEALNRTLESGQAWFWSRSRQELWHKGATSGNYLNVRSVITDCDGDTVLLQVEPAGPACHTGAVSCFFDVVTGEIASFAPAPSGDQHAVTEPGPSAGEPGHPVDRLFATIEDRKRLRPEGSYVAGLLERGTPRVARKIIEEAGETVIAALSETDERLVEEVADLWFHSLVLLSSRDVAADQVWQELERRRR